MSIEYENLNFYLDWDIPCGILEELRKRLEGQPIIFMYDIACILDKHLKVKSYSIEF